MCKKQNLIVWMDDSGQGPMEALTTMLITTELYFWKRWGISSLVVH
jgi:hypothetical protein